MNISNGIRIIYIVNFYGVAGNNTVALGTYISFDTATVIFLYIILIIYLL